MARRTTKKQRNQAQKLAEELSEELPRRFSLADIFRLGSKKTTDVNVIDEASYLIERARDDAIKASR